MGPFVKFTQPTHFRNEVYPFLLQNEAENCMLIGIIDTLINTPERYPLFHLGAMKSSDHDSFTGAIWITPPHPLGMTRLSQRDVKEVVKFALTLPEKPSSAVGPSETVENFKDLWIKSTGAVVKSCVGQGIYELRKVEKDATAKGKMRLANESDKTLLENWSLRFSIDCGLGDDRSEAVAAAAFAIKHKSRYFWELDDHPVSMAGVGGNTPNGIKVAWVYTPPEMRGKGFASALVTTLSQAQLDAGKRLCFLYTDLANPISNAIYQRIGYKKVCESKHYHFTY